MKTIIIGSDLPAMISKVTFKDAQVFVPMKEEKWRRKRAWVGFGARYLPKPMGLPCHPVRVITHVDYRVPTQKSLDRYKVKSGMELKIPFAEIVGHVLTQWPFTPAAFNKVPRRISIVEQEIHFYDGSSEKYDHLIWTDSLVNLLYATGLDKSSSMETDFPHRPVYVRITMRPPDAPFGNNVMYINYVSDPSIACHRFCDRDGERHYEGLTMMGQIPHKKLIPGIISESKMSRGMVKQLSEMKISCVGRDEVWSSSETLYKTWEKLQAMQEVMECQ